LRDELLDIALALVARRIKQFVVVLRCQERGQ
jgi:hypothetical protein